MKPPFLNKAVHLRIDVRVFLPERRHEHAVVSQDVSHPFVCMKVIGIFMLEESNDGSFRPL